MLRRFLADETGATAVEYALIALLVAMALIIAALAVGNNLSVTMDYVATSVGSTTP